MSPFNRGLIIGLGGLFSGLCASWIVDWNTTPKAALASGVAVVVSLILVYVIPEKKTPEKVTGKNATWQQRTVRVMGPVAGLTIIATCVAKLAGLEFWGALSLLNNNGIWILVGPVIGLFAIFRHGRWTGWKIVESSTLLSAACWLGWAGALVVGVVDLFVGR